MSQASAPGNAATLSALLLIVASMPALAATDLTGKWVGTFSGVQVAILQQQSSFDPFRLDAKKVQAGPRFVESTLQLDIETQKNDLAVGSWGAGEFKQRFVCAQTSQAVWNCVDAGGRSSIEVKSATEIRVCYLDNGEGAPGAGCALLRKAQ